MSTTELRSLEDILVGELRQLYSSTQHMLDAVPEVLSGAPSCEAREALTEHIEDTKCRLQRVNEQCEELGIALDSVHLAARSRNSMSDTGCKWDDEKTDCRFDASDHGSRRNRSPRQPAKFSAPSWLYAAR